MKTILSFALFALMFVTLLPGANAFDKTTKGMSLAETRAYVAKLSGHKTFPRLLSRIQWSPKINFRQLTYPMMKLVIKGAFVGDSSGEKLYFPMQLNQCLRISSAIDAGTLRISSKLLGTDKLKITLTAGKKVLMSRQAPLKTTILGFVEDSRDSEGGIVDTAYGKDFQRGWNRASIKFVNTL